MWFILKTLCHFGRHIGFVWFDSNLLQRVSVAVVQISVRKVFWSSFCMQYFEFVGRNISVDLTSSEVVVASA